MECGEIKIIKVHAGQTYFYDGKYLVKTTKPHTSEDRYVTLRVLEPFTVLYRLEYYHNDLLRFECFNTGIGSEIWGEIDRCHMVRKTPVKIESTKSEFIGIVEITSPSQTYGEQKSFNEMKTQEEKVVKYLDYCEQLYKDEIK